MVVEVAVVVVLGRCGAAARLPSSNCGWYARGVVDVEGEGVGGWRFSMGCAPLDIDVVDAVVSISAGGVIQSICCTRQYIGPPAA